MKRRRWIPEVFVSGFWYFFKGYLVRRTARTDGPQICLKGQISTARTISLVTIKYEFTKMTYTQFHYKIRLEIGATVSENMESCWYIWGEHVWARIWVCKRMI